MLALAAPAVAQVDCPQCVLGIWDQADILGASRYGTISVGIPKPVYVGICFAPGETGLTSVEFSVEGLDGLLITASIPLIPTALTLGSIAAPSSPNGTGGINIAWASCLQGSQALLKVELLTFTPVANQVLRIAHKYPPSNPNYNLQPVLTRCDDPEFTSVRLRGGCYILNWDQVTTVNCYPFELSPCTVGIARSTWTQVKALYRD